LIILKYVLFLNTSFTYFEVKSWIRVFQNLIIFSQSRNSLSFYGTRESVDVDYWLRIEPMAGFYGYNIEP
jgi:hypothetical protein